MSLLINLAYNCCNCGKCWETVSDDVDLTLRCTNCGNYEQPYARWPCVIEYYDEEEKE